MKEHKNIEKILIVDSNIDYAKFLQGFLKNSGYMCYIAVSYEEALNLTYEKVPDCILVDYMLPCSGACKLAKRIKSDNLFNNISILFLTANENKDECLKSFECGADGFFPKAIDTDIFLYKMKSYIRLKKDIESNILYMDVLKRDIEYAAKLQNSILSYGNCNISKNEVATFQYAPNDVSGDYIGIKKLKEDCYGILIADVSGHGVAASLLTILIKSFFDTNAIINSQNTSPSVFLKQLNTIFIEEDFDKSLFASIFYGIYNNKTGDFNCSSGGAPKPFYYSNSEQVINVIDIDGPLIGMVDESEFAETHIKLKHNDMLFIFTDGTYEVFDEENKMFGDDHLKNIFYKNINKDVNIIKNNIVKELKKFTNNELSDDTSMFILRRTY